MSRTVIQLPEWNGWRIEGEELDWQIQELRKDAKADGGERWRGVNFFPHLSDESKPCGREHAWAHALRMCGADAFGDWSIRDVCQSAACAGTVVATLRGKLGTVEAWNNGETFFIPKGTKPSKEPNYREVDAANGIAYRESASRSASFEDIAWACGLAGIQERMAI